MEKKTKPERKIKSLKLHRETLTRLDSSDLRDVVAGYGESSRGIPTSCCCAW
jgi:hypothetical protein